MASQAAAVTPSMAFIAFGSHRLRLGAGQHYYMAARDLGRLDPMRLARKRSQSGCMVRSFLATMYQLGFDFQAVPSTFAPNRSGVGTH